MTCGRLEQDLLSVILYDSLAWGNIWSGSSDFLDVVVIFRDEVFDEEARYIHILDLLIDAFQEVSAIGLPCRPFQYFSFSEFTRGYWSRSLPILRSEVPSRVVYGEDLRSYAGSIDADSVFLKGSFFATRRTVYRLSKFVGPHNPDRSVINQLLDRIRWFCSGVLKLACLIFGASTDYPSVFDTLRSLFPTLEIEPFVVLDTTYRNQAEGLTECEIVDMVGTVYSLYERLREVVVARLKEEEQWDSLVEQFVNVECPLASAFC